MTGFKYDFITLFDVIIVLSLFYITSISENYLIFSVILLIEMFGRLMIKKADLEPEIYDLVFCCYEILLIVFNFVVLDILHDNIEWKYKKLTGLILSIYKIVPFGIIIVNEVNMDKRKIISTQDTKD